MERDETESDQTLIIIGGILQGRRKRSIWREPDRSRRGSEQTNQRIFDFIRWRGIVARRVREVLSEIVVVKIDEEFFRRERLIDLLVERLESQREIGRDDQTARKTREGTAIIGGRAIKEPVNTALDETAQRIKTNDQQKQIRRDHQRVAGAYIFLNENGEEGQQTIKDGERRADRQQVSQRAREEAIHIQQTVTQNRICNRKRKEDQRRENQPRIKLREDSKSQRSDVIQGGHEGDNRAEDDHAALLSNERQFTAQNTIRQCAEE